MCRVFVLKLPYPLSVANLAFIGSVAILLESFLKRISISWTACTFILRWHIQFATMSVESFCETIGSWKSNISKSFIQNWCEIKGSQMLKQRSQFGSGCNESSHSRQSIWCRTNEMSNGVYWFWSAAADKNIKTVRSPFKFIIVHTVPNKVLSNRTFSVKSMSELLQIMYESNQITSVVAYSSKAQFSNLCSKAAVDPTSLLSKIVLDLTIIQIVFIIEFLVKIRSLQSCIRLWIMFWFFQQCGCRKWFLSVLINPDCNWEMPCNLCGPIVIGRP